MNVRTISVSAAFIALSLLMQAETVGQIETNLANTDGVFGYCERTDPTSAAMYKLLSQPFTPSQPARVLNQERSSHEYKVALDADEASLSKISLATGLSACTKFLNDQGANRLPKKPL